MVGRGGGRAERNNSKYSLDSSGTISLIALVCVVAFGGPCNKNIVTVHIAAEEIYQFFFNFRLLHYFK